MGQYLSDSFFGQMKRTLLWIFSSLGGYCNANSQQISTSSSISRKSLCIQRERTSEMWNLFRRIEIYPPSSKYLQCQNTNWEGDVKIQITFCVNYHKVIFGNSRMKILLHSRGNSISWLNLSSLHSTRSSYLYKSRAIFWEYL